MFENGTSSLTAKAVDAIASALQRTLRSARGYQGDKEVRKKIRAVIGTLPAVRSKHYRERRDLAVMWLCVFALIGGIGASFGMLMSAVSLVCGLVMAVFLAKLMRVTHGIAQQGYEDDLGELLSQVLSPLSLEEEEEGLIKDRDDAPLLWDAAYVMSKKSGLPLPRIRIVHDPKVTAQIAPRGSGAEILIDQKTIAFVEKKKFRAYVLFGHEYGHWLENDCGRSATYLCSVALLCAISLATIAACIGEAVVALILQRDGLRLCVEGIGAGIIGVLLSLAYGTIGYVARRLDSETAADAIAAHLVGSPQKVASFFQEGSTEWVFDPHETYNPFRRIVHPPLRVRARRVREDALR